jgi:hypothetical protein
MERFYSRKNQSYNFFRNDFLEEIQGIVNSLINDHDISSLKSLKFSFNFLEFLSVHENILNFSDFKHKIKKIS